MVATDLCPIHDSIGAFNKNKNQWLVNKRSITRMAYDMSSGITHCNNATN